LPFWAVAVTDIATATATTITIRIINVRGFM